MHDTVIGSIPFVIDNQRVRLDEQLCALLNHYRGRSLDIATAYFTLAGYRLLQEGLEDLGSFRLLLGAEPSTDEQIGLRPDNHRIKKLLSEDLENLAFDEATLKAVEDLIVFLKRDSVAVRLYDEGFLHAKCYLFYADRPAAPGAFDRLRPVVGIVGSSNFTGPGLTSNRELNLVHKTILSEEDLDDEQARQSVEWVVDAPMERAAALPSAEKLRLKSEVGARAIIDLERWFETQWKTARDFKDELIELLDASKFGQKQYSPYQVYMKALFEYFQDELGEEISTETRSAIDLAEFQEDAVKKARKILSRYSGAMVADSVGLGKTWIGKKLLEDSAYHLRQKAVVICPASLLPMWTRELREAAIPATILSQEELGREEFDPDPYSDADILLIDESHNFRNRNSRRYETIEQLIGSHGGRGRDGQRKKIILLTATPVNNDLFDLYNQLSLITQGDRSFFAPAGIGDLYRYFLAARRNSNQGGINSLFNLLEEVVIRRTRPFIRRAYSEATIRGKKIRFPERSLRTVEYNLEETYSGIYEEIVAAIEELRLVPYNLESYKREGAEIDDLEVGREQALVGIFKSRYLKRFESSVDSFRISIRRSLAFLKTFESYLLDKRLLRSKDFRQALRYLSREEIEDDATPSSLAFQFDETEEVQHILSGLEPVDHSQYDLRKIHDDIQSDIDRLQRIWDRVRGITPERDAKLQRLKEILKGKLKGQKLLIFTYYKDTARYLYWNLGHPDNPEAVRFAEQVGATIRRMDSDTSGRDRTRVVEAFAPVANGREEWIGTEREIDILISTDVLSEGQNLQDCGQLLNFDLHWNPTRMVQRAGRIDRIGSGFDRLWIYNMFPDKGLERLLGLVQSLTRKIEEINQLGLLDASVLGEEVKPRNFNTLRRIREEDNSVIQDEEEFSELASSEFLLQQLRSLLDSGGRQILETLPDGIHSGLAREGACGVFFYFRAIDASGNPLHFWRYCDLKSDSIVDNRYLIANLIACETDTPRYVDPDLKSKVFELQEKAIEDILGSVADQKARESAPRAVDPVQQNIATLVQEFLNHPDVDRQMAIQLIRYLNTPMLSSQIKELRRLHREYLNARDIQKLLSGVGDLKERFGERPSEEQTTSSSQPSLRREDLRLICFDFLSGG